MPRGKAKRPPRAAAARGGDAGGMRAAGAPVTPEVGALVGRSMSARANGDLEAARSHADAALARARIANDRCGEAQALFQIGAALGWGGRREESLEFFRGSARVEAELRHFKEEAESWQALGESLTALEIYDGAIEALRSMEKAGRRIGDVHLHGLALLRIADAEARCGRVPRAKNGIRRALAVATGARDTAVATDARILLSKLQAEEGDLDAAAKTAMEAAEKAGEAAASVPLGLAFAQVARVLVEAGEPALAYAAVLSSIGRVVGKVSALEVADIVYHAAISLAETGLTADAAALLEKVFQMSEEAGDKRGILDATFGLARIAELEGRTDRAVASYRAVQGFAVEIGDAEVAEVANQALRRLRKPG
jgi:tetratricopeptide (TPR) repeat protein